MRFKIIPYCIFSYTLAVASCVFLFLSTEQTLSDPDYLYNHLKLSSEEDSTGIPIIGSVFVSLVLTAIHSIFHFAVFLPRMKKKKVNEVKIRIGFFRDENAGGWIGRIVFYALAILLTADYIKCFYKFYSFEFIFTVLTFLMLISYGNAIGMMSKKK